jgi:hypothetical protein
MSLAAGSRLVQVKGQAALLDQFQQPLQQALGSRRAWYVVEIEAVGRIGEVLVSVTGVKGRLPMLFAGEDLEPGYVTRVVADTVTRFGI